MTSIAEIAPYMYPDGLNVKSVCESCCQKYDVLTPTVDRLVLFRSYPASWHPCTICRSYDLQHGDTRRIPRMIPLPARISLIVDSGTEDIISV